MSSRRGQVPVVTMAKGGKGKVKAKKQKTNQIKAAQDEKPEAALRCEGISALKKNETWDLVPLPAGVKPISCKWVYKVKRRSDGSVERARLVARAFSQQYGIDYDGTKRPVAKITTVRVLISLTTSQSWADGRQKCLSLWRLSTPFPCLQSSLPLHSHHMNEIPHSKPSPSITECFLSRSRTHKTVKVTQRLQSRPAYTSD